MLYNVLKVIGFVIAVLSNKSSSSNNDGEASSNSNSNKPKVSRSSETVVCHDASLVDNSNSSTVPHQDTLKGNS